MCSIFGPNACVIENNKIRVPEQMALLADILNHEYGHIVHGAESGHHIYAEGFGTNREGFLEGLAEFFKWSVELEQGWKGLARSKNYQMAAAEGLKARGPDHAYWGVGSYFWDVADYSGSHEDTMTCPPTPRADTSTSKHVGVFDSLTGSPDNAPDWAGHWRNVRGLQPTAEAYYAFQAITNHHNIAKTCSWPTPTPQVPPTPAPTRPPCPPNDVPCAYCSSTDLVARALCLAECANARQQGPGGCNSPWCIYAEIYIGDVGCP